ncbi:MAG: hypothetical protein ISS13_04450 [Actinobacteria bacterium]|nr:hypothetical protein [Actinomycetota bacterium]
MKKVINISGRVTFTLGILSLCSLIYNLVFYETLRPKVIRFEDISGILERMEIIAAVAFIIIFFFHISAISTLAFQLKFFKRASLFRSFLFFMAIISLLMVFGDFALLSDIGKEHIAGLETQGEWVVLYFSQALHFILNILIFVLLFLTRKSFLDKFREDIVLKDEAIFINAQYIGIFCGVFGIGVFSAMSALMPLWALRKGIFVISLIAVLPYLLIVIYWLIMKFKEKVGQWYDEKQYQDITKASLTTLIVSIIIMTIIFIVQYFTSDFDFITITWFPFYVFLVLLLFSSSTLYYSKRAAS